MEIERQMGEEGGGWRGEGDGRREEGYGRRMRGERKRKEERGYEGERREEGGWMGRKEHPGVHPTRFFILGPFLKAPGPLTANAPSRDPSS